MQSEKYLFPFCIQTVAKVFDHAETANERLFKFARARARARRKSEERKTREEIRVIREYCARIFLMLQS